MNEKKRIFVIAGEPSGDQHAAEYIKKHTDINPNIIFDALYCEQINKRKRFNLFIISYILWCNKIYN